MPARTAAEAVEEYRTSAARALSCITSAHVDVGGGYAPSNEPHALVVAGGDPVALRGDSRLTLSIGEQYGVVDEADVQVGTRWLGKVHLRTGPVALHDLIALSIEELGVMPLRDEWASSCARCGIGKL